VVVTEDNAIPAQAQQFAAERAGGHTARALQAAALLQ
jgi:hypothetical protein